jgi:hypothetical protein
MCEYPQNSPHTRYFYYPHPRHPDSTLRPNQRHLSKTPARFTPQSNQCGGSLLFRLRATSSYSIYSRPNGPSFSKVGPWSICLSFFPLSDIFLAACIRLCGRPMQLLLAQHSPRHFLSALMRHQLCSLLIWPLFTRLLLLPLNRGV